MASHIDLETPDGRRRARRELVWDDHGFLRFQFRNLHRISDEMYRSNQPSPEKIALYAKELGLKTILNLRGASPKGHYLLEQEACARHGIELVDFQVFSREVPTRETVLAAKRLFETITYPALMHCKSGADRAGIMAVLYRHFHLGESIRDSMRELGIRTLHVSAGKTGVLGYTFERYLQEAEPKGISFIDWVMSDAYDPVKIKQDFQAGWWATVLTDKLLRRE